MQSRQNLIPMSRYLSLTIPASQPNKNRKSRSRSLSKLPHLVPFFQLASRVLPQKIAKSRIPPKPIADILLSTYERLTCSKSRHCRAQLPYGVFPGLFGQGISVAYPRQNQLAQNNEAQGQGNGSFATVNITGPWNSVFFVITGCGAPAASWAFARLLLLFHGDSF